MASFPKTQINKLQGLFKAKAKEEPEKLPRKKRRCYLKASRQRLAIKHIPLAYSIAERYFTKALSQEEKISSALFGLTVACMDFNWRVRRKNITFKQHAERYIVQQIRRDIRAFYRWRRKHVSGKSTQPIVDGDQLTVDTKDDVADVLKAMRKLQPHHREVLRLYSVGATYAEIAEITGYSVQVARSLTYYAIDRLCDIVNQQRS